MELKSDPAPRVQLGCGTLILIALIVMLFSGRGENQKLRRTVEELHEKIDRIEKKVDSLAGPSGTP